MEPDQAWLLTPPGPGAIAVIRIRGNGVHPTLQSHFSKQCVLPRCVHGELRDESGAVIDDPVVVVLDALTADINVHGGGAVIRATLSFFERRGFRIVAPALDPSIGSDLVAQEMHAALRLPRTKAGLVRLLAQPRLWGEMNWTRESAAAALADRSLEFLLHPPTIAIIGIANVGKSTLANQLFGQTRSIVLDQPGTTRDYVGDLADLDGLAVHLIDTPGQRATDDPIEASAIALSGPVIESADLQLLLLDPTQPEATQRDLIARFPKALRVANKADAPAIWQTTTHLKISANVGTGIEGLIAAIQNRFGFSQQRKPSAVPWTQRQRDLLRAIEA